MRSALEDKAKIPEIKVRMHWGKTLRISLFFVQDEEINELSQMIERLKEQMLEQEDLISMGKRDYENLQQEMSRIQADNDSAKDEVRVCVGSLCVPVCTCVYLCVHVCTTASTCIQL